MAGLGLSDSESCCDQFLLSSRPCQLKAILSAKTTKVQVSMGSFPFDDRETYIDGSKTYKHLIVHWDLRKKIPQ